MSDDQVRVMIMDVFPDHPWHQDDRTQAKESSDIRLALEEARAAAIAAAEEREAEESMELVDLTFSDDDELERSTQPGTYIEPDDIINPFTPLHPTLHLKATQVLLACDSQPVLFLAASIDASCFMYLLLSHLALVRS